ncbi:MAG TPA: hypothetical protein VEB42_04155 [Chitinophagaceae bacterium]|nr:hypothetical protein [Chitinophagaceae bacterium]
MRKFFAMACKDVKFLAEVLCSSNNKTAFEINAKQFVETRMNFMLMKRTVTVLILLAASTCKAQAILEDSISRYFREAKAISEKDNGKCWGEKLYGPMILVDQNTGWAVANEQDPAKEFSKSGDVYIGKVPRTFGSNTAKQWGGKLWTVILWPLPKDKKERANLMMHELFHQFELRKGMPAYSPVCDHLDRSEGRLLLKLELEALRKVINDYPNHSRSDLQNALAMRKYRYQKFPQADSLEHSLEMNEGLATFTGFILSGMDVKDINRKIDEFYNNETYVRSLGYVTGYVYGYLLSRKYPAWNKEMKNFDEQLMKLYHVQLPASPEKTYNAIAKNNKYGFSSIYAVERSREEKRLAIERENREKFIDGPVLELPAVEMNINFNPNEVQVLEGVGPVYPSLIMKAAWGVLEVSKGGALVKDWIKVYVPLPEGFNIGQRNIQTADWKLELKDGWMIIPGKRKGDYLVSPAARPKAGPQ